MRKVGILSDTEQTRNRDFKKTQLASREHIASRLAKAKSIEKELKYADRVPARVPGGLVRVNLRETMTGVDRRVYVDKPRAQPRAESNVAQEGGGTYNLSGKSASLLWAIATGAITTGQGAASTIIKTGQGAANTIVDGVSTVNNALSFPIMGEDKKKDKPPPPPPRELSSRPKKKPNFLTY